MASFCLIKLASHVALSVALVLERIIIVILAKETESYKPNVYVRMESMMII